MPRELGQQTPQGTRFPLHSIPQPRLRRLNVFEHTRANMCFMWRPDDLLQVMQKGREEVSSHGALSALYCLPCRWRERILSARRGCSPWVQMTVCGWTCSYTLASIRLTVLQTHSHVVRQANGHTGRCGSTEQHARSQVSVLIKQMTEFSFEDLTDGFEACISMKRQSLAESQSYCRAAEGLVCQ